MPKPANLADQQFGDWTALEYRSNPSRWLCRCKCGTEREVFSGNLMRGLSKGCGCNQKKLQSERMKTHGEAKTKLYGVWCTMRNRCYNKNTKSYVDYGAKGVRVCDEWNTRYEFFRDWSLANGYKEGLEIDRIDYEGDYTPENCRWVTRKVNANNKRGNIYLTISGVTKTLPQWSEQYGVNKGTVRTRLKLGWPVDESLFVPGVRGRNQTYRGVGQK